MTAGAGASAVGFELFKFAGRASCDVFADVTGEPRRPATMSAAEKGLDPMAGPAGCPKPAPKCIIYFQAVQKARALAKTQLQLDARMMKQLTRMSFQTVQSCRARTTYVYWCCY